MTYKTIHTTYGLAAMSAAEASGVPINLTHMAVGDGNGNPVTPTSGQTALVRELYRSTVNRVYPYPDDATRFVAEMVVPASIGGFTMREVGVFDASGSMFVVGNLPETYKPTLSEGSFADTVVRIEFVVSNATIITLQVDPNVAVATQTWISNNVTAASLIPGGTTHQVFRKRSNADGDTEWVDPTDANVVVDMIEEDQTLAAAQTVVTLASTTTNGVAVYIEGVRLKASEWTATSSTHITLGTAYPAGTSFTAVQNEPAGSIVYPLAQSLNLSDVPDKAAARNNLGVPSISGANASGQPGAIMYYAGSSAPVGWLKANGAAIPRAAYATLFSVIGITYGAGDGISTFNLPDLRGEFVRGWDDSRGVDAGRALGSAQGDAIRNIVGSFDGNVNDGASVKTGPFYYTGTPFDGADGGTDSARGGVVGFDASRAVPTASENRPRNRAFLTCIKY